MLQPGKDADKSIRSFSEASLPGHLRGDGEKDGEDGEPGQNAGDVLDGDAPIAAALVELKKPVASAAAPATKKN